MCQDDYSWEFSGFLCSAFIGFFHWFCFLGLIVTVLIILFGDVALAGTNHTPQSAINSLQTLLPEPPECEVAGMCHHAEMALFCSFLVGIFSFMFCLAAEIFP